MKKPRFLSLRAFGKALKRFLAFLDASLPEPDDGPASLGWGTMSYRDVEEIAARTRKKHRS